MWPGAEVLGRLPEEIFALGLTRLEEDESSG